MTGKQYDKVMQRFLRVNITPKSRVVDVGCGTGWTALYLSRCKKGCEVEGVDINEVKVHRANRLFLKAKRDHLVHCLKGRVEKLDDRFPPHSFDYAVSVHSLHHFSYPVRALRAIRRILDRDGVLLLCELTSEYGLKIDNCDRYSSPEISLLVKEAGFKNIKTSVKKPGVILIRAKRN